MSSPQISFEDPQATRGYASDAKAISEDLQSKVTTAMGVIEGLESGAPWGNDEPGKAFANGPGGDDGYVANSTGYRTLAPKAGPAAVQIFGAVEKTVDTLTGVDADGEATINGAVPT